MRLNRRLKICLSKQHRCGPTINPSLTGLQSPVRWSNKLLKSREPSFWETSPLWLVPFSFSSLRFLGRFPSLWGPLFQYSDSQIERHNCLFKICSFFFLPACYIRICYVFRRMKKTDPERLLVPTQLLLKDKPHSQNLVQYEVPNR